MAKKQTKTGIKNKSQFQKALVRQENKKAISRQKKSNLSNSEISIFNKHGLNKYHVLDSDIDELSPTSNFIYLRSNKQFYTLRKKGKAKNKRIYHKGQLEVTFLFTKGNKKPVEVKGISRKYSNIEQNRHSAYEDCLRMAHAIYGGSPDKIEIISEQYVYYVRR